MEEDDRTEVGCQAQAEGLQMELSDPGGAPTVCLGAVGQCTHCALIDPRDWCHSVPVLSPYLTYQPAWPCVGGPGVTSVDVITG